LFLLDIFAILMIYLFPEFQIVSGDCHFISLKQNAGGNFSTAAIFFIFKNVYLSTRETRLYLLPQLFNV